MTESVALGDCVRGGSMTHTQRLPSDAELTSAKHLQDVLDASASDNVAARLAHDSFHSAVCQQASGGLFADSGLTESFAVQNPLQPSQAFQASRVPQGLENMNEAQLLFKESPQLLL